MTRATATQLAARIPILHHDQGYTVKQICTLLGVKKTFAYKTLQYHRIHGHIAKPHTPHGRNRILNRTDIEFIQSLLSHHRTIYVDEIQEELRLRRGVSVSFATLVRTLRRLRLSNKAVSAHARERDDLLRAHFMNRIGLEARDPEMLMFCDEASKDERTSARRRGWSMIGQRCVQRKFFVRGRRFSILPVLTLDGIIAHDIVEGSVTSEKFIKFLREYVVHTINLIDHPSTLLY